MPKPKFHTCPLCGGYGVVEDNRAIGNTYKMKRKDNGLSQRGVARFMGYSSAFLCNLESGKVVWTQALRDSYDKALRYADILLQIPGPKTQQCPGCGKRRRLIMYIEGRKHCRFCRTGQKDYRKG